MRSVIGSRPIEEQDVTLPLNGERNGEHGVATYKVRSYRWVSTEDEMPHSSPYEWLKAAIDRSAALVLLIVTLPLMVLAALAVKFTSPGSALYSQLRVGRHGRPFWIYKLRTMHENCEAVTGAKWCVKNDPRVTPVGRFLRKMHIDELPQLFNVLRGDMSLIGPRPERPEFVDGLVKAIPGYRRRLAVKPGVTGLAQIQLPPDSDLLSVRDKLVLDVCYVEQMGLLLDIRIVMGTGIYLMGFSYATVRALMALPKGRPEEIPAPQPLQLG